MNSPARVAPAHEERSARSTAAPRDRAEERELFREEAAIARKYVGGVPWVMVAWGFGNLAVWLSLWPLTLAGVIPLWLGFLLSTLCVTLCYLPSHEAQHSNIAAEGEPMRWLNETVGYLSTIPLVLPYKLAWVTHRRHHAHANDPEKDPDYGNKGENWVRAILGGIRARQPGAKSAYRAVAEQESEDPEVQNAFREGGLQIIAYYTILTALAWSGFALEALFLWWLPRHLGSSYIQLVLSWAPHHPMEEKGRYRDTRAWRCRFGTIASLGMEYHIVHHLHPSIPLHKTGHAYREMRHLLVKRGCRIEGL